MCLYTDMTSPLVTDKDIFVYKKLKADNSSPIATFHWEKDKLYESPLGYSKSAYTPYATVDRGFHSFKKRRELRHYGICGPSKIVIMMIPKGSQYYLSNEDSQITSNQMVYPTLTWRQRLAVMLRIPIKYELYKYSVDSKG
jgi:hypothetical protein